MTVFICILPGLFTAVEHSSILPVEVAFKPAKRTAWSRAGFAVGQSKQNITKIGLEWVLLGIGADSTRVNKVVNELKVKSVEELIASCREMPSGGAAPTAAAEEKEEKKKEVSEPRSMTTWASVSLGALAFLPPKTAERHCVVQSFWNSIPVVGRPGFLPAAEHHLRQSKSTSIELMEEAAGTRSHREDITQTVLVTDGGNSPEDALFGTGLFDTVIPTGQLGVSVETIHLYGSNGFAKLGVDSGLEFCTGNP
ncbi:hypothetical protein pipiens_019347 [Culex pipiens pipiens]|uniref:Uncharacterized protein n=1 Tax=Culex pipiens pipiens TaxID=38569 RepID=A0ABD1DUQ4_CULPP